MTAQIKELFHSKWLALQEKTLDNGGKYIYTTAPWCNSEGVAILPYKRVVVNNWGHTEMQFLGRYELCPSHSDKLELGAIMGGMDKEGEEPIVTAWRELIEEGGLKVPVDNIMYLGTSMPSKSSDNIMYLYAVDIDKGFEEVEATGDGTLIEEGGYSKWISLSELVNAKEPLLQTMYLRMMQQKG
ncbi:NUDIX domain-containing protein [Bacillus paranthracis]|uniref:NUDIX domain-containing protein n=1 Tax=Bacillus paranthracis TaxID=2026186 RepID=UPI002D77C23B|nr:NUDIX domain-containing protein [Bacillus paranthracis]